MLRAGDRLVLACHASGLAKARSIEGLDLASEMNLGLEQIAAHEGMMVEGILRPNSEVLGKTIEEVNFQQRFRMVVLAVHRKGKNVRDQIGVPSSRIRRHPSAFGHRQCNSKPAGQ